MGKTGTTTFDTHQQGLAFDRLGEHQGRARPRALGPFEALEHKNFI